MSRLNKFAGSAATVGVVCLLAWYWLMPTESVSSLSRFLRSAKRKLISAKAIPSRRMASLPNVYLWAWERPEDLKFLGGQKVGIAFLSKTIYVEGSSEEKSTGETGGVFIKPRMQPLRVIPGTPLMAVVRIETLSTLFTPESRLHNFHGRTPSEKIILRIADEIADASKITGVSALQVDFDATSSEHPFYRALLTEVRKRIPAEMPLSITALATWCTGDHWLEQLPPETIDEAVPMLFRMGHGHEEVSHFLESGKEFTISACATSIGISTDEPFSRDVLTGKIAANRSGGTMPRIYVFSPHPWEPTETEGILKDISAWHGD
jgi:Protein of unknown function (DUF3142)